MKAPKDPIVEEIHAIREAIAETSGHDMERIYPTPWTRCDREGEYRIAWEEFERRAGA